MIGVSGSGSVAYDDLVGHVPKITKLCDAFPVDENVSGFDVTVQHSAGVKRVKSHRHLGDAFADISKRHWAGFKTTLKRSTWTVVHHDQHGIARIIFKQAMDVYDVGVPRLT